MQTQQGTPKGDTTKVELIALYERSTKNNHCYKVALQSPIVPFIQSVYLDKSAIQGNPAACSVILTVEIKPK